MSQLHNLKHEAFALKAAHQLVESPTTINQSAIYSQVYGVAGHSAEVGGSRLMQRAEVAERIRECVLEAFPPQFVSRKLKALANARKGVYYRGARIGSEPDGTVQLQTVQTLLKVAGLPGEPSWSGVDARSVVNFTMAGLDPEQVRQIAETLSQLNQSLALPERV